ncbi:hypothetical protein PSUB009319_42790 [Ralstonia sp. SET104]|nr:hypothetical protein PSUB009319_42790 [Ralstonia sp. SET104]
MPVLPPLSMLVVAVSAPPPPIIIIVIIVVTAPVWGIDWSRGHDDRARCVYRGRRNVDRRRSIDRSRFRIDDAWNANADIHVHMRMGGRGNGEHCATKRSNESRPCHFFSPNSGRHFNAWSAKPGHENCNGV